MAISDIQPDQPTGQDLVSLGDDQLRRLKQDIKDTLGGLNAPVYEDAALDGTGGSTLLSSQKMSSWETRIAALEELGLGAESGTISVGMIMFLPNGVSQPAGWAICNGTTYNYTDANGDPQTITTPDLRGRFLVASGATNGPVKGETGGPFWSDEGAFGPQLDIQVFDGGSHSHSVPGSNHTLTQSQIPSHYHFTFRNEVGNHENSPADQTFDTPVRSATAGNPTDQRYTLSAGGSQNRANQLWTSNTGGNGAHSHPTRQSASAGNHQHNAWVTPFYYCGEWIMYIANGTPA